VEKIQNTIDLESASRLYMQHNLDCVPLDACNALGIISSLLFIKC